MTDCLFCNIENERIIAQNEVAYAIRDGFPVTDKHTLIIPKRHTSSYFDLNSYEKSRCDELLSNIRAQILLEDDEVTAFNIGINIGKDAGQTIFHCHIHLIPRRTDDVENPKGGVRGVIPSKQSY